MASDAPELDLYADDIGDEFNQEYTDNDLYDDVLTSNRKQRSNSNDQPQQQQQSQSQQQQQQFNGTSSQSSSSQNAATGSNTSNNIGVSSGGTSVSHHQSNHETNHHHSTTGHVRRYCLYVGNLTWWTTDEDVIKAMNSVNINDVTEVKFYENRANGQSKGFCVVTLQSEPSMRSALEKVPKCVIHGQNPVVTLCNRQNLAGFEMKSRKIGPNGPQNAPPNNAGGGGYIANNRNYNPGGSSMPGQRPPLIPRPMRPNGPLLNLQSRMPPNLAGHQSIGFGGQGGQPQWNQLIPPTGGPRNPVASGLQSSALNPMLRMNPGNRQMPNQALLSAPANQGDLRSQISVAGMGGVQHPMGGTHPLFSSQTNMVPTAADMFGNARLGGMTPFGNGHPEFGRSAMDHPMAAALQMSEAEFDEILSKNKSLSASAISRAVNDAASGDYSAAIDTLSTAISLIKGSRVAHDERCKIIISSLQDTLQGIEQKSYSSGGDRGSMRKDRPRSRSRDRDRGSSRRDKDRRRDRSRSRERDYRERSRERYHEDHRYHEDRYRDKDRDRDHRGRH